MKKLKNSSLKEQISARVQLNKDSSFLFLGWIQSLYKSELMLGAFALTQEKTRIEITRLEEFCYTLVRPKNTFESEATEGGKLHFLKSVVMLYLKWSK